LVPGILEFYCNNAFVRSWTKCKRKILGILSLLQTFVFSSVAECLLPARALESENDASALLNFGRLKR
jgi:hypothetical protein